MVKYMERRGYDVRKVTRIGNSKGITLPEEWVEVGRFYKLIKDGERIILEPV